jgi:uncharacterized protein (TIGR03435 family)
VQASGAVSMASLADFLSSRLDRPVLDRTELKGAYTISLNWAPDALENAGAAAGASGPSIFTALQEQLGLRLTAAKGPVEILIVDSLERSPTEN